jgi:uncharacterized membrane protein YkoI
VTSKFLLRRGIMKAPRILLRAATIALVAGVWPATPAQTGAADVPRGSLTKAVDALENSTGGKVLEIRFVDEVGHEHFEGVVAKPDEVVYVAVNPVNEEITEIAIKELPAWMLNWKLTQYVRSIQKANMPLAKAVADVELRAQAPAIGAGLAKPLSGTNHVLAYNIELLLADGKHQHVAIDNTSGARIANPEELYEPWTPVKLLRN